MSTLSERRLSPAEYLAFERASETRHEFYNGEIFAMSGAPIPHNTIALNIAGRLRFALRPQCRVFQSDLRVKVNQTGLYTYPDVTIVCGPIEHEDAEVDTVLNPSVLFEILSPTTENYDRGNKANHYFSIPSLREYVLVAQNDFRVDVFSRQDDDSWNLRRLAGADQTLHLRSVDYSLPFSQIYLDVDFSEAEASPLRIADDNGSVGG